MNYFKCIVIGPPVCGKTSLINTYMTGQFNGYIPHNIIRQYDVNFVCKSKELCDLSLFTSDRFIFNNDNENTNFYFKLYDYDIEKSNSIQFLKDDELNQVDLIILCYQSFSKSSKDLLLTNFNHIIKSQWPKAPILLVSCLSDLNKDNSSFLSEYFDDNGYLDAEMCNFKQKSQNLTKIDFFGELFFSFVHKSNFV